METILSNRNRTFLFFFLVAVIPRLIVWHRIPVDWNSDSYHHWQISYLSLKIGFPRLRMWDLNGCECYWGLVPHVVQAALLWAFSTTSILPYRALNVLLGGVNAYLVYLIGRNSFHREAGFYAGIFFAVYPIGAVFDAIAMQETLALCFALLSILLFRSRPGWSGLFLALAGQSRTEFWLVAIFFVAAVVLVERFSTGSQPFVLAWLGVTLVFCIFFRVWTLNPVYPLYWSLFNVFGGWTESGLGLPFHALMLRWIGEKLSVLSSKVTGLLILGSFAAFAIAFVYVLKRRLRNYHVSLFFLSVLVVFAPLFVTYYPKHIRSLLLMLRASMPIAALGSVLLYGLIFRAKTRLLRGNPRRLPVEAVLILATVLSFRYVVPAYDQFQADTLVAFAVADEAINFYEGGTIVCDNPTMNYRFVSKWCVGASDLLGNHYSPNYYGVTDPLEYARWFEKNNITLWIYAGIRAYQVWTVTNRNIPDLLVLKGEVYGVRIFAVDRAVLDWVLTSGG
jgi:hypothetical protein